MASRTFLQDTGARIEELAVADIKVKLRAGINAGNWQQRGDAVFAALASSEPKVALAMDELPILVNRLLKDDEDRITPDGRRAADALMSWLRRAGQAHRGKVVLVVSGSVGLEPLLEQSGLSAQANIFTPYDLKPWTQDIAAACLAELAESYRIGLPEAVRKHMCHRLRCCIPHHVQMFFDKLHDHLRRSDQHNATLEDAEAVYLNDLLSVRGQMDLQHYESRLRTVLGRAGYPVALEMLTEAAVQGHLDNATVGRYRAHFASGIEDLGPSVEDVLHVLEHDGYLERWEGGYCFVSRLLEDWWRIRHGGNFTSVVGSDQLGLGTDDGDR